MTRAQVALLEPIPAGLNQASRGQMGSSLSCWTASLSPAGGSSSAGCGLASRRREPRLPLLDEVGDALLEVVALEAERHLVVGVGQRFLQALQQAIPKLALDDADRARRDVVGE